MKSVKTILIATAVAMTGVFAAGSASAACTNTNNIRVGQSYFIAKNSGCGLRSARVRLNAPDYLGPSVQCVNFNGNNRTQGYLFLTNRARVNATYGLYYGKNCSGKYFGSRTQTSN